MFAGTGVELRLAKVTGVDVDRKTVAVVDANGAEELAYDTLVYALGSGWNDQGVPGTAEHAYEIAEPPRRAAAARAPGPPRRRADRGRRRRRPHRPGGRHRDRRGPPGPRRRPRRPRRPRRLALAQGPRRTCGRSSTSSGSPCTSTPPSPASRPTASSPPTAGPIPAAVTVWTTGFAVHPIAQATTLEVTGTGQIVVDGTMRSVSHPDVYAVGDAAMRDGRRATSRCGCRAPRAPRWRGRPPTRSPRA